MNRNLEKRIEQLWASQYYHGEKIPGWYKYIVPLSPSRETVSFSLIKNLGGQLLDIGCGTGNLLIKLSNHYKKLTGIDIVDYRIKIGIERIKRQGIRNISLKVGNIEEGLKFPSSSFDVIVCLSAIEYTFDPYFTIGEINRILKKAGTFVMEVPNIGFIGERLKLLFGGLPNVADAPGWQGGRLHNFTQGSLTKMLSDTGFSVEKVTCSGFLNSIRAFWPSLLSGDLIFICRKK